MHILIYHDQGASQECVDALQKYYKTSANHVECVSGSALQQSDWIGKTQLLIMPGGRSLPFYDTLGITGNQHIQRFVAEGGLYLGICAGAYYACSETIFAKNTSLELLLPGELHFFSGKAIGPVFTDKPFAYGSESGAQMVDVIFKDGKTYSTYFNGGCYFDDAEKNSHCTVLARYAANHKPAIIACAVGKGAAILSGVHPELSADFHLFEQVCYSPKLI